MRKVWVLAAQQDGGESMEEGSAGFLLWTTNDDDNNGAVDLCPVHNRKEGRPCLETIDWRKGHN